MYDYEHESKGGIVLTKEELEWWYSLTLEEQQTHVYNVCCGYKSPFEFTCGDIKDLYNLHIQDNHKELIS